MENINNTRIQNEIEHGKFIAGHGEEIWNWSSPAGRLRWQRRVDMFRQSIGNGHSYILEIGCGTGLFTEELAKTGNRLAAIDVSDELLEIAKKRISSANVEFLIENAYDTNFPENTFDYIVGSSVLHHLDVATAIKECYRLLKSGGSLVFTEPNMLNPQIALQKNIPWLKKKLGDSPDETAFIRWRLKRQLQSVGFKDIEITPFDFIHPFIPGALMPYLPPILQALEKIPLIREISGSLFILAKK